MRSGLPEQSFNAPCRELATKGMTWIQHCPEEKWDLLTHTLESITLRC